MDSEKRLQMELNRQLFELCIESKVKLTKVEKLLKWGAQPLGQYNQQGDVVLNQIISYGMFSSEEDMTIYEVIKVFLKYGMVINKDNILTSKDERGGNPYRSINNLGQKQAIRILDLLIKEDTEIDLITEMIEFLYGIAIVHEWGLEDVEKYVRVLIYLSSIPYVFQKCHLIYKKIDIANNNYDLNKFHNPFDYYFKFEILPKKNNKYEDIKVRIFEKQTKKQIWEFIIK